MNCFRKLLLMPILATVLHAESAERELVFKEAKREQIRHSMIGPRDTLVFYSFGNQAAVLVVNLKGETSISASGTLHLFPASTTGEDLAKWVNNRHSDGLYADAPVPDSSVKLPESFCKITEEKRQGEEKSPLDGQVFTDWKVRFKLHEVLEKGRFRLLAFEDEADVFVKQK